MPHFQLDDPRLQHELDRLGAEDAAAFPPLDDDALAQLARILPNPVGEPEGPARDERQAA